LLVGAEALDVAGVRGAVAVVLSLDAMEAFVVLGVAEVVDEDAAGYLGGC
jgi:hypothetical protein